MIVSALAHFFSPFFPSPPPITVKQQTSLPNLPRNLKELQALLLDEKKTWKDWLPYQQVITDCIEKYSENPVDLDHFLSTLIQHVIKENAIESLNFISSLIPFRKMEQMLQLCKEDYPGIEKLAKEEALLYPKIEEKTKYSPFYRECRRLLASFFSLVTNLIDSVLEVLSLSHTTKFRNLFDRNQIWDIFFKLFAFIPYILIPLLRPFVSDKVYLVAILFIAVIGILTICYKRWIKPLPTIINSERLEEQIKKGKIHTVENTAAMQELIQSLAINEPVLLVGKSGEGKTALVHHLVEWKNQKSFLTEAGQPQPSHELQQLSGARINCGSMIGDISFGHVEQMETLANQVRGWHKRLFLFFDEFYQIVTNPNAFRMFKDCFLKGSTPIRFISAVTYEEFKKLKEIDFDHSFRRCVNIIFIQGQSSNHLRLILREVRKRQPRHIHISDQAIEKILELSKSEESLKGVGRPARAVRLLNKAAGICMAAYQGHYTSKIKNETGTLQEKAQIETDSYTYNDSSNAQERKKLVQSKQDAELLQNQLKERCQDIEKIKSLFDVRENLKKKYKELTHFLAGDPPQPVDAKARTLYLLYHFYARGALMNHIQEKMEQLKDIPLQVNEGVIQQAFEVLRHGEQQAHA